MSRATWIVGLLSLATGCVDTSIQATSVDLSVAGTDARAPFEGRRGATITLSRADVAFGPVYLCAGYTAGELCDEALAEWRDAAVVDALSAAPTSLGAMVALTGTAHSYMFDYGIVSLLTSDAPLVTAAAESLGPASAVVEGVADVEGQSIPFTVRVRVEQSADVEQGVPVVRSGEDDGFEHPIAPDGGSRLLVRFDPRAWLAMADFAALVEDATCAPGLDVACAGPIEQRCAADVSVAETRDCAALGGACVRDLGCVERLELGSDDQVGRALRIGLEAGARPELVFE